MNSDVIRRWNLLYQYVNSISVVGSPGLRDPEYPCEFFKPDGDITVEVLHECFGDGHYMCKECLNLTAEDPDDEDLVMGSWPCPTSPVRVCQYKPSDTMQDFCVHCRGPNERK